MRYGEGIVQQINMAPLCKELRFGVRGFLFFFFFDSPSSGFLSHLLSRGRLSHKYCPFSVVPHTISCATFLLNISSPPGVIFTHCEVPPHLCRRSDLEASGWGRGWFPVSSLPADLFHTPILHPLHKAPRALALCPALLLELCPHASYTTAHAQFRS